MKSALLLALVLFADSAFADVVGTYATGRNAEKMTIYYKNDGNIRIAHGREGYMLISGDKVYAVRTQNGKTTAMDMDQVGQFAKQFGGMRPQVESANPGKSVTTFKKTGRTETIAGYKGDVYEVTTDGRTEEYVASRDKDVVRLNNAFYQMGRRMSQSLGQDRAKEFDAALRRAEAENMGGMLRFGNDMVLQSLSEQEMGVDFYRLPAGSQVESMPDMSGAMKQSQAEAARQQAELEKQQARKDNPATDIADEATDAARDETKTQVRESVQNAIRGLFGR